MKKVAVLLGMAFIAACGPKLNKTTTTSNNAPSGFATADVERAAQKFPGATSETLTQGKTLYQGSCARCHGLKDPTSKDEAGWRRIVPPMARKANLDAHSEELILEYVVTMSGK